MSSLLFSQVKRQCMWGDVRLKTTDMPAQSSSYDRLFKYLSELQMTVDVEKQLKRQVQKKNEGKKNKITKKTSKALQSVTDNINDLLPDMLMWV